MKVIEILYWIGSIGMLLLMLYGLFNPSALPELAAGLRSSGQDLVIGSYSLEIEYRYGCVGKPGSCSVSVCVHA